jgi:hypothetical protein
MGNDLHYIYSATTAENGAHIKNFYFIEYTQYKGSKRRENCIMRSFKICNNHQVLLRSSNGGG